MEPKRDSLFGAVAVQEGFASEDEVAVALEAQKDVDGENPRIGQILLEMGALNQAQIDAVLAAQSRYRSASGVPETLPEGPAARPPAAGAASSPRLVQESGLALRVNGEALEQPRLLLPGDRLEVGGAVFLFEGNLPSAPLLVPRPDSTPAREGAPAAREAPAAAPVLPAASSETPPIPPAEGSPAPEEGARPAVTAILDRLASRLLPGVHNHRKYVVALASLGLVAIVLPWRIASNGNTVVGLQGPGWLTFWLLGVTTGCATLLRVSQPIGRIEWSVMAGSSGAALLAAVWKFAAPPAYASGRGIGLYLTLLSAALVQGLLWLLRGSSSPAVAAPDGSEPAALRLVAWAKRKYRDFSGQTARETAARIQRRDELLQEIGRAALASRVEGLEADLARDAAGKFASAEAAAGEDLKARALLKAVEGKAKRALGKLGRLAMDRGLDLPAAAPALAECRALEVEIGQTK